MTSAPVDSIVSPRERSGALGKLLNHVSSSASVGYEACGDAMERVETARQIDARGDAALHMAIRYTHAACRAETASDRTAAMRLALEFAIQAQQLDALEDEHVYDAVARAAHDYARDDAERCADG